MWNRFVHSKARENGTIFGGDGTIGAANGPSEACDTAAGVRLEANKVPRHEDARETRAMRWAVEAVAV